MSSMSYHLSNSQSQPHQRKNTRRGEKNQAHFRSAFQSVFRSLWLKQNKHQRHRNNCDQVYFISNAGYPNPVPILLLEILPCSGLSYISRRPWFVVVSLFCGRPDVSGSGASLLRVYSLSWSSSPLHPQQTRSENNSPQKVKKRSESV